MRRFCAPVSLLVWLHACAAAPVIPAVGAERVSRVERKAREVEVCLLMGEREVRPAFLGVDECSLRPWQFGIASVVVKHPDGLTVIDPAFGVDVAEDLAGLSSLFRLMMGGPKTKTPLVDLLRTVGLAATDVRLALATHVHWDHVGALRDLPNARVLLGHTELEWSLGLQAYFDQGVMPHHLKGVRERLAAFEYESGPVDGFSQSHDVFGDGSVVAVPMPGHTPGSVGFFLRAPGGRTFLLVGDTAWTKRGLELPAHKSIRLDSDLEATGRQLGLLNAFLKHRPDITVVPAHDAAVLELIPACRR
jgi:N-acyl homoserine lactone hydrolase